MWVNCIRNNLGTFTEYRFLVFTSTPFSPIIPSSPSPTESKRLFYTSVSLLLFRIQGYGCFPGGSEDKASACNAGDPGLIPGLARSPGEGNGNPLQYSCLENPMDRGAWRAIVHGVAKHWTRLSNFTFFLKGLKTGFMYNRTTA